MTIAVREAQAQPGPNAGSPRCPEGIEDLLQILVRDSDPCVADLDGDRGAFPPCPEQHPPLVG